MAENSSKNKPQSAISRLMRPVDTRSWRFYNPEQVVASDNPQEVIDLEAFGRRGVHVVRKKSQYASSEEKEIISLSNFVIQRIAYRSWNQFAAAASFFEQLFGRSSSQSALPDGELFVINDALVKQLERTNAELGRIETELVAKYGEAPLPKSSRIERIAVPITSSLARTLAEMLVRADRLVSIVEGLYLSGDFGILLVGQAKRKENTDRIVNAVMGFVVYVLTARERLRSYFDRKRAEEAAEAARLKAERDKQIEEERRRRELAKERREYARQQSEQRAKEILDAREREKAETAARTLSDRNDVSSSDTDAAATQKTGESEVEVRHGENGALDPSLTISPVQVEEVSPEATLNVAIAEMAQEHSPETETDAPVVDERRMSVLNDGIAASAQDAGVATPDSTAGYFRSEESEETALAESAVSLAGQEK